MRFWPALCLVLAFCSSCPAAPFGDDGLEHALRANCLPPTPRGQGFIALRSGQPVRLRFPVPHRQPLGYWVGLSNIVALNGTGSAYRLILRRDNSTGPIVYTGQSVGQGEAWNSLNRTPINLLKSLTKKHRKQGYIDLFADCAVRDDGWAIYRHQPGRPIQAFILARSPEREQAARIQKAAEARRIAIIPFPQSLLLKPGTFRLTSRTQIQIPARSDAEDAFAARDLADQIQQRFGLKIRMVKSDSPIRQNVIFLKRGRGKPESYRLKVSPAGAEAAGSDASGVFYAAQTIAQLAGAKGILPACDIVDFPAYPLRGLQYDVARGQTVNVPFMKRVIRELARCKLNALMFYGENDYRFEAYPFLGREGAFTPEKAKELSEYARRYHMQLIPQFESLGHAGAVLSEPRLGDLRENGDPWVFCTSNPRVWEFLDTCFRELTEWFPYSRYLHFGGDEFEDNFARCPVCQERASKIGIGRLYAEHMNRLSRLCRKYNRTMLFWPSHAARTPERSYLTLKNASFLNRDAVPIEWIYHGPSDYPELKQYLKAGFRDCWTSPAVICYDTIWPDYETSFRGIRGMLRAGAEAGVRGTCVTTWQWTGGSLANNSWPGFLYAAECAWSLGKTSRRDFARRLAARFYGVDDPGGLETVRTLLHPFPDSGPEAAHRDGRFIQNLFWTTPRQMRSRFSFPASDAARMRQAADAAISRLGEYRKRATCNNDLLSFAETAFRIHRLAILKWVAFEEASLSYKEAIRLSPHDRKAGAAKADDAARIIAALIPGYRACAGDFQVAIDRFGHWPGDREQCLALTKSLEELASDIRQAARSLEAGQVMALPAGLSFGLTSGAHTRFATWEPARVNTEGAELRFNATGLIKSSGTVGIEWIYMRGAHGLYIDRVSLLCNGQEVSADEHHGWAGSGSADNLYLLPLSDYRPGAAYEIVAKVRSSGGTDSYGEVTLIAPERQ